MNEKARVLIVVGDDGDIHFQTSGEVDVDYWEQGAGKESPDEFRDLAEIYAEEHGLPH